MKKVKGVCISSAVMAVLLVVISMGTAGADATYSSNGYLRLYVVDVPGDGVYDATLKATDDSGREFELRTARLITAGPDIAATFSWETGILYIPQLAMYGVSNDTKYVEVEMVLVPGSDPMRFIVLGVHGKQLGADDRGPKGDTGPVGPIGPTGAQGLQGIQGVAGTNCWDLNANGVCDAAAEDKNADSACNASDCQGPQGIQGPAGAPGTSVHPRVYSLTFTTYCPSGTKCPPGFLELYHNTCSSRWDEVLDASYSLNGIFSYVGWWYVDNVDVYTQGGVRYWVQNNDLYDTTMTVTLKCIGLRAY